VEIERKFLVRKLPADLDRHPSEPIEQGYLALDGDGVEVRVRRRAGRAVLTVKQGSGLVRLEEEFAVGQERFERLWPLTEGRRIEKVRHLVPVDGATAELDVYEGALAGLVVAEVEFDSVEASESFRPPEWLGHEVTGDPGYANRTLACDGRPDARSTFRMQPGESISEGLPCIARGRIDKAIGMLAAADADTLEEAIHGARKALKRLRSTLRLARDELGDDVYRRENTILRDAGRRLSGPRDSQVVLETLGELVERHRDVLPAGSFDALREALRKEHEAAQARVREDSGAVSDVVGELRDARERTPDWPLGDDRVDGLASGFRRIYRRGRKALAVADDSPGTESLHELRKRVKDLWYASQIVRPAAPKSAKKLADRAHDVSDLIGEDHDLAVLLATAEDRREALTDDELATLAELIGRRRAKLQRRALKAARRLYRRKPGAALAKIGLGD